MSRDSEKTMTDPINHPQHYTQHPSGIECIQITEHMGFNLGNAIKYIWRADLKEDAIEDLKKARWYLDREIQKREIRDAVCEKPRDDGAVKQPHAGKTPVYRLVDIYELVKP